MSKIPDSNRPVRDLAPSGVTRHSNRRANLIRGVFRAHAGQAKASGSSERKLSIHKELPLGLVSWRVVADILVARFHVSQPDAAKLILKFKHELSHSFNLFLHLESRLPKGFSALCLAITEAHGTDSIEVFFEERTFGVDLKQSIHFRPRRNDDGSRTVDLSIKQCAAVGKLRLELNNRMAMVAFQAFLVLIGAIVSSIAIGLFLYSIAVLVLFLLEPGLMLKAATDQAHLGLALLTILTFIAWSGGRFVRHYLTFKRKIDDKIG